MTNLASTDFQPSPLDYYAERELITYVPQLPFAVRITAEQARSRWLEYLRTELQRLGVQARQAGHELSEKTLVEALRAAVSVMDARTPAPSVVLSDDGGVRLVWHKSGWDVEMDAELAGVTVWAYSATRDEMLPTQPLHQARRRLHEIFNEMLST